MNVFEIIPIIYYSVFIVIALYVIGFGFTTYCLPKKLKPYVLFLTPWFTLVAITFVLTILSLAGISVRLATWVILPVLLLLTGYTVSKQEYVWSKIQWKSIAVLAFVFFGIALHLMPLLRRDRMLTTISLGNNDVIVYADTPDYLENHSIFEGYKYLPADLKPNEKGVANLLHLGFRWGTPIMSSFLQVITGLKGYQIAYLYQVILYALLIPLAYVLYIRLFKESWMALFILGIAFIFNVNMLYMLYHVFAGQMVFWGIFLLLLIYFVSYFEEKSKDTKLTYFDVVIGITITTLYMSYHEGVLFVVAPAILYAGYTLFQKRFLSYILAWSRIGLIVLITGSPAVINATIFDFFQASLIDAPIGWELFRASRPFADVFDMAGMHSIHTMQPLRWIMSIPASVATATIFLLGYLRSRMKVFVAMYILLYILMLVWSSILHNNFFVYNRVVTYMLPLMLVVFTAGLEYIISIKKVLGIGICILFVALNIYSGSALLRKFMNNHVSVDRSLISLQELDKEKSITETIYLDQVIMPQMYYWRMIWMEYFLYPNKNIISPSNYDTTNAIKDGDLLLVQNSHFAYPPPKVVLQPVVWDNGYFKVGRVCLTNECLLSKNISLSEVVIGTSEYEDTMLLQGWSANEGDHRWANAKQSTARFIAPKQGANILEFEARSLQIPQKVQVEIDDIQVSTIELKKEWDVYRVPFYFRPGMHKVLFTYEKAYKPAEVLGNADTRELYVDFRRISFK